MVPKKYICFFWNWVLGDLLGLDICFNHLGIIRLCQEHVQPFTGKYDWD